MKRVVSLFLVCTLILFVPCIAFADSYTDLINSVNTGDASRPDTYFEGRDFDVQQYPGVFDSTRPLMNTCDFVHPSYVGYVTYKNWFYSTGNSKPYTLRTWYRYFGPDVFVRFSTGSMSGQTKQIGMYAAHQDGGCSYRYSSTNTDWYDRIRVNIQNDLFLLPGQDYYLSIAGNAQGSFLSPTCNLSNISFEQLSQQKYGSSSYIVTYRLHNSSSQLSNLDWVEFTTSHSGAFALQSFTISPYSSSAEDVVAAIENQTDEIINNNNQHWNDMDNDFQGSVNGGQAGANSEIAAGADALDEFDNQIFQSVDDYVADLDFGLTDWAAAASGISYIGSVFLLIWENSPTQVIVLSLMLGLCILLLGRGARIAGAARRHSDRGGDDG